MAEPTQYNFPLKEVGEILLRQQKITSGKWSVGVSIGINIGNMAFAPGEPERPSAAVLIDNVVLSKVPDTTPATATNLVVDASKL